jgi:CubicO group peptidase (beta-lactamase class C family)
MALPRPFSLSKLILAIVLIVVVHCDASGQVDRLGDIGTYIERGMAEWSIPGLAVAVVHHDEVIMARGFGVRRLGESARVDENTLFGVASTTKAMTVAALAVLVDEGHISWDDRVVDLMPEFRLSDPWATANTTIRDLLSHRVGVGRMTGNRIQYMPHRERSEIIYRMRYHDFEQPFRQGFVYSNVMYMVAGEIIPAVTGRSWDSFVEDRVFAPLGMTRSNTSITRIAASENAAWPHQEIRGSVTSIPRRNFDNVGPSASVNTSAYEMAQWMRLLLGEPGVHDGRRLISGTQMGEMHQAHNAIRTPDPVTGSLVSYGLGWRLTEYRGRRIAQHGGATDGMNTNLVLVPGEDLGVVVMTNTFNGFTTALANEIIDRVLDVSDRTDWAEHVRANYERSFAAATARRLTIESRRITDTSPTRTLTDYAGVFLDSLYDSIEVRLEDGELSIEFWNDESLILDLEHWHYDTFRGTWRNPALREKFVWFDLDADGSINTLNVEFTLRPVLLQVGLYPSDYARTVTFRRSGAPASRGMAGS